MRLLETYDPAIKFFTQKYIEFLSEYFGKLQEKAIFQMVVKAVKLEALLSMQRILHDSIKIPKAEAMVQEEILKDIGEALKELKF